MNKAIVVIGGGAATGLCGSGLIDLAAVLVRQGVIDETGRLLPPEEVPERMRAFLTRDENGNGVFHLTDKIFLTAGDVRSLQLAKAAVAAGVQVLLAQQGITLAELDGVYLAGGFGVLDEVNMAKNEALAVLHATLDHRRVIDVPGYQRIELNDATRFIGTMNYGYAGTRELNEALVSRFVVVDMPVISDENLQKLLRRSFPTLKQEWAVQLTQLFRDLRQKCDSGEISTKALDLRGLLSALHLVERGIPSGRALEMGIISKAFEPFERQLVADAVWARLPKDAGRDALFG